MQFFTTAIALLTAATTTIAVPLNWNGEPVSYAHLTSSKLQEALTGPYTAADAFENCQAKGAGDYVCWANEDAHTYGIMGASELKKNRNTPVRELIGVPIYCCKENPWENIKVDDKFADVIDVEKRAALGRKCTPIWWG